MGRTKRRPKNSIRELRVRLKWSQEHLAREAGLSTGAIRKLEAGGQPRADTADKIAKALSRGLRRKVSIEQLLEKASA